MKNSVDLTSADQRFSDARTAFDSEISSMTNRSNHALRQLKETAERLKTINGDLMERLALVQEMKQYVFLQEQAITKSIEANEKMANDILALLGE